eukprot:scpid99629/ scgid15041/ 
MCLYAHLATWCRRCYSCKYMYVFCPLLLGGHASRCTAIQVGASQALQVGLIALQDFKTIINLYDCVCVSGSFGLLLVFVRTCTCTLLQYTTLSYPRAFYCHTVVKSPASRADRTDISRHAILTYMYLYLIVLYYYWC